MRVDEYRDGDHAQAVGEFLDGVTPVAVGWVTLPGETEETPTVKLDDSRVTVHLEELAQDGVDVRSRWGAWLPPSGPVFARLDVELKDRGGPPLVVVFSQPRLGFCVAAAAVGRLGLWDARRGGLIRLTLTKDSSPVVQAAMAAMARGSRGVTA